MRQILLCVAGLTPQIITETLYVLTQQHNQVIDEIRVITTLKGRDRIRENLLSRPMGKFWQFCQDFSLDPETIAFSENNIFLLNTLDGRILSDILSEQDNFLVADQICQIVAQLTSDPEVSLHASVAGGRKSMGILLTAAMQLFGRPQDRLSHVLVTEDFELHSDFYYTPPQPRLLDIKDRDGKLVKQVSTDKAMIYLADIPFIRLRGLISERLNKQGFSYNQLVKKTQEDLDLIESVSELYLDICQDTVSVGNRRSKLTPREFFIYLFFAQLRQRHSIDFIELLAISPQNIKQTLEIIATTKQIAYTLDESNLRNSDLPPRYDFIINLLEKSANLVTLPKATGNYENPKEDLSSVWLQPISRIKRKFIIAGIPDKFFIISKETIKSISYGLDSRLTAEQIKFSS